jgi:hypothetical protein
LDLTELTEEPEFTTTIGGYTFHFSELPIAGMAKLQGWIKTNVPDPLVTLRERLQGYPDSVVAQVVSDARRETPHWPPIIGSPEAALIMMGTQQGQVYSFWIGLLVHHSDATIENAERIYRTLKKARNEKLVTRIFRIIFGRDVPERDEENAENSSGPKGEASPVPASNGNSTSERPSSVSR